MLGLAVATSACLTVENERICTIGNPLLVSCYVITQPCTVVSRQPYIGARFATTTERTADTPFIPDIDSNPDCHSVLTPTAAASCIP